MPAGELECRHLRAVVDRPDRRQDDDDPRRDRRSRRDERDGAGPGFGLHIVDVEVDRDTGRVDIKRYTVVEDAGKAIHPLQVEGQYQGGAVQGIGWALNEEYYYGEDGRMQNASFLDYRMPVASDVPMIGTEIVEVPNPRHPYGLRGVGEVPVVPTMAAIANAIGDAIGIRPRSLPMSPPRLLKLMDDARAGIRPNFKSC